MVAGHSFLVFVFNVLFSFLNACGRDMWRFTNAILHCSKPGFHPVASIRNDSDDVQNVRYIQVVHSPFYYEWYLAYDQELRNQSLEEFRLWIMDPKHVSQSERNRTASVPSQFSKELTGVFVQMGQSPVLKVKVGHRFVSWDEWKIFNKSYITNEGYWQFSVTSVPNHQLTVWIDGQSVGFQDQFIRKSSFHLLKIKFPYLFTNQPEQVVLKGTYPKQRVIFQV
ncbi:uncharacterized protein [Porites lutea]|uniref:uncharacterized protein n=1 Tax=Porites lutea TaxID=51062 RepID=UPI003CC53B86